MTVATTVAVPGSMGLVGAAVVARLLAAQVDVRRLIRRRDRVGPRDIFFSPTSGEIDSERLEAAEAVVHLAGANIGEGRWTRRRKAELWDSRVRGTELLAGALAQLRRPPRVLVSASAVGFYGARGDAELDERSSRGQGFLAELCEAWEGATAAAVEAGVRVVHLRIGMVLSGEGGALARMVPAFRMGLGGKLGSGTQHVSWISLPDLVRVIEHALGNASLSGPVNAVAPEPVTNAELTRELGEALRRPTVFSAPAFALKAALGPELARELLLSGQRVVPRKLLDAGFVWDHPTLAEALAAVL